MNHFEEILREGQSLIHHQFPENQQLYDKSTNQSNLMSTAHEPIHSPFDSSPKASMFFFSVNSPRNNADNFHFNQQNAHHRNLYKEKIQPISRRLEFQEDQSLFCEQEELQQEQHSAKQQQQWNFESSSTPGKSKKIKKTKNSKGLKNLSIGVYEIVAQKYQTTYKEVANTLIDKLSKRGNQQPISDELHQSYRKLQKDEHNVKRRVYDALNVLISAELLRKEGKRVICNYNLQPQNGQKVYLQSEYTRVTQMLSIKQAQLQEKRAKLEKLKKKHNKIQFIINRNIELGPKPANKAITMPFIIVKSKTDMETANINKEYVQMNYKGNILIMGDVDTLEEMIVEQ